MRDIKTRIKIGCYTKLRFLYLGELDKEQKWSPTMLELLRDSIHQRKTKNIGEIDIGNIKKRFDVLMKQDLSLLDKKFESLRNHYKNHPTTFYISTNINNDCEEITFGLFYSKRSALAPYLNLALGF